VILQRCIWKLDFDRDAIDITSAGPRISCGCAGIGLYVEKAYAISNRDRGIPVWSTYNPRELEAPKQRLLSFIRFGMLARRLRFQEHSDVIALIRCNYVHISV